MANSARTQPGLEPVTNNQEELDLDVNPLESVNDFYDKNKKNISTGITVVVVLVVGVFGYFNWFKKPKEEKALKDMAMAQLYFQADSVERALNGDGRTKGFKDIMSSSAYSGTPGANIAHFYAGVCYMKMHDYKNAIKALKDFDGKGTILAYQAYGELGIAYMESGDVAKAIEYFTKATENKDDQLITPLYLYHLGIAYEANKNLDKAKEAFKRIKNDYPRSIYAREMDKELARMGELE